MAEPRWHEVRAVVRCDPDVLTKARSWLDDSGLVEVARIDVIALDDDLRRWDGGRPPGVVSPQDAASGYLEALGETVSDPMDGLRRGIHLHEQ